ncbi:MAG: hypothetical protein IJ456_04555, partial [Bacteroides sp.]|nr:hypothetical protein [Bacteroides sp.]
MKQRYNIREAHCPPMSANVRKCPPFGRALIRQGLFLHKTFKEDSQQNPYKSTFLGKVFSIQLVKIVLLLVLGCPKEKLYIII